MTHDDISGCLADANYVVAGFFTPDFASLAHKFAGNLAAFSVPHMLYARPADKWARAVLAMPSVVARAMASFCDRTVVLMDLDCEIRGPIRPIVECTGDVALFIGVGEHPANDLGWRMRAIPSSRIIVWRQTDGARRLLDAWTARARDQIEKQLFTGEQVLMRAIAETANLSVTMLDRRYAARNPWETLDDPVIVHNTISRERPSRRFFHQT